MSRYMRDVTNEQKKAAQEPSANGHKAKSTKGSKHIGVRSARFRGRISLHSRSTGEGSSGGTPSSKNRKRTSNPNPVGDTLAEPTSNS